VRRLALRFAVVELDADNGVRAELRGFHAQGLERGVLLAHFFMSIDDTDDLRRTIEVFALQNKDA
jgi:hypothetical protein